MCKDENLPGSGAADPGVAFQKLQRRIPVNPIETLTDALPSGLSMAMMPFSIDWPRSTDTSWLLNTVNLGSNPVSGRVHHGSVRVPLDAVVGAEYMVVRLKMLGLDTPAAHAQLRFLFDEDASPQLATPDGDVPDAGLRIPDLVVSWEAWRRPGQSFDFIGGIDSSTYALSARAFDGSQRFLEDGLKNNSWGCYPLNLPGGRESVRTLLATSLTLGDAVGRSFVRKGLRESSHELDEAQREAIREWVDDVPEALSPLEGLVRDQESYQLLERSCITLSLYTVDCCLDILHQRGVIEEKSRIDILPESIPDWLPGMAHADRRVIWSHISPLVQWITQHSTVIPGESYRILEKAGLLKTKKGRAKMDRYDLRTGPSPYGDLQRILVD